MSSFTQCIARTAIGLAALSAACSVQAFADDDARRAILELRESIKTLQADLEANRNAQIQLSTEINNLKELNRRLTGRIEELVNAQNQEKRNARTQYETLDKRLAVFEPQVVVIDGQSIEVSAEEKRHTIRQWRFCRPASTAMRRRRSRTSMTTSRSRPTGWMHFSGGVPVRLPMSTIKRQFHLKINCFESSQKVLELLMQ